MKKSKQYVFAEILNITIHIQQTSYNMLRLNIETWAMQWNLTTLYKLLVTL